MFKNMISRRHGRAEFPNIFYREGLYIFHQMSFSFEGCLPSKVVFHQRLFFIFVLKTCLEANCNRQADRKAPHSQTSPPSARVAALKYMLQQNWKTKLYWWNTLPTSFKIFLKHTWHFFLNTLETFLKHG